MLSFFKAIGTAIIKYAIANPIQFAFQAVTAITGVKGFLQARQMLSKGQDIMANKTAAGGKIPIIYGTRRVGAQIVYMDTAQNRSKDLFVVYAISVGECEEILGRTIEIDGNSILDGNIYKGGGYVGSDKISSGSGSLNTASQVGDNQYSNAGTLGTDPTLRYSFVFNLHHGASSQTADPMLRASIPTEWTTNHKLNGICYIAASFDYDKKGMYKGVPQITVQVKGKKVYDPRESNHTFGDPSTYEWSSNPALCFLDYITNDEYGKGLAESQINMTAIGTAADKCNTKVDQPYYNGSYQDVTWSGDEGDDFIVIDDNADWWQNKVDEFIDIRDVNDTSIFSDDITIKGSTRYEFYDDTQENRLYIDGTLSSTYTNEAGSAKAQVKRFHCNGYIDTNKNVMDNANELLANMRGILNYVNGKYELQIEDTGTSTFSITDDHIIADAGISVDYGNKDKKANKVVIEFFNANKKYELDTATVLHDASPEYYSDDGEVLEIKAEFPYVTDPYIAYNMGKAILTRSRNQTTMQFLGTPEMYKLNVGDIVDLTYSGLGFSAKPCRVEALELQANGLVSVSLIEYFDVYTWEVPAQESVEILAKIPTIGAIHPPEANSIVFTDTDDSAINRPTLTWTEPTDFPVKEFRVDVEDTSNPPVQVFSKLVNTNSVDLSFLPVGNYNAIITSINGVGIESADVTKAFTIGDPPTATADIQDDAVVTDKITDDAITTPKILDNAVTDAKINSLTANKITAGTIDASVITVTNLDADNITSGSIGADRITVDNLSAIDSDLGDIDAGSLNIGSGAFVVTTAGAMTATSADVVGNLQTGNLVVTGDAGIHGEVRATSITAETVTVESIKQEVWNEIDRRTAPAQNGFYDDFSRTGADGYYVGVAKNFDLLGTNDNGYQINSKDIDLRAGMVTGFGQEGTQQYTGTALEATFQYFYKLASDSTWTAVTPTYVGTTDAYTTPDGIFYELDADPNERITAGTLTAESYYHFRLRVTPTVTNNVWTDSDAGSGYKVEYGIQQSSTGTGTGTGTVTSVSGGDGITASPSSITTTGSLAVDSTVVRTSGVQTLGGNKTFSDNVVIQGNLDVQGTTTTIDTANLDVKDKNITLNYSTGDSSASANGAGITIQDAVSATQDATLTWNTANDSFNFSHPLNVTGAIATTGNITLSSGGTQVKFTGSAGPFGLEFGDTEANPNFRIYYRTTPNTLTFENSGQTAKHTFDLDGDYTAVRDVSVGRNLDVTGNISVTGTVDGRDIATDGTKLDGIEAGATTDQTQAEINALGITAIGLSGTPNITVGTISSGAIYTTGNLTASNGVLRVGLDNTTSGAIDIYGGSAGVEGGEIRLHTTNGYDSTYEFYRIDAFQDDLRIGRQGQTDFEIKDTGTIKLVSSGTFEFNTNKKFYHTYSANIGIGTVYGTHVLRATDAQMDLVSSSAGTWGSALNLVQGNNTSNTNVWSIARKTSGGGNSLHFNFGTNNQHDNTTQLSLSSSGDANFAGTVTADGLTVDGTSDLNGNVTIGTSLTTLFTGNDIEFQRAGDSYLSQTGGGALNIRTNDGTSNKVRLNLATNGDISFYEDTGTSQNLKWDASADSLNFVDNAKAQFGAGNDLQIYHDGSNSNYIKSTTSDIYLRNEGDNDKIYIQATNSGTLANYLTIDGSSNDIKVHKNLHASDNVKATFGTGNDLQIYHDGHSYIKDTGSGNLVFDTNGNGMFFKHGDETLFEAYADGAVNLRHNNQPKLSTTSSGIDVTGTVVADNAIFGTTSDSQTIVYITSSTTGESELRLGDTDTDAGSISYTNSNDTLTFRAAAANRMSLNSTGLNVTGTVATNGLTVDANSVGLLATFIGSNNARPLTIDNYDADFSGSGYIFNAESAGGEIALQTASKDRIKVGSGGDISFYEDTGTTAKFFWDASAERLGLGTASPSEALSVSGNAELGSANYLYLNNGGYDGAGTHAGIRWFSTGSAKRKSADIITARADSFARSDLLFRTQSGTANADPTEVMRVTHDNRVGIGTSSPSHLLSVGTEGNSSGKKISLYLGGTNGNYSAIGAQRAEDNTYCQSEIRFINENNSSGLGAFAIATGNNNLTERMRITSAGSVLVGTTDSSPYNNSANTSADNGIALGNAGNAYIARYNFAPLDLNRTGSDGDIIAFRKSGSIIGGIGTSNTRLHIGSGDAGLLIAGDLDNITPWNSTTGASRDAAVDLGNSGVRFKDLYLSGTANIDKALIGTSSAGATDAKLTLENGFSDCSIYIGAGGDYNYIRSIRNANNDHDLAIGKNYSGGSDAEHLRITNEGNLLVGKNSDDGTAGVRIGGSGTIVPIASGIPIIADRLSSDGEIIRFRKDGGTVGSIGTSSADGFYIHSTFGNDSGLVFGSERIVPCTSTGVFEDGVQDLGYISGRFKDLYLSSRTIIGDGSNSAPAYTFSSDADTGMYRVSTNALAFATGGTERWRITSSGTLQGSGTISSGDIDVSATNTNGLSIIDSSNSNASPLIKVQGNRQDANESQSFTGGLALSALQTNALANDGKHIGTIYFGTNHTNGTAGNIAYSASISARLSGAANSATDMPTDLVFYTGSSGTSLGTANTTFGTQALKLDSSQNATFAGNIIKSGGTDAQFLKADGSVQSTSASSPQGTLTPFNEPSEEITFLINVSHLDGLITGSQTATLDLSTGEIEITSQGELNIKANSIEADKIASNTITANEIASGTITASEIASSTITGDKINVDTLNVKHFADVSADIISHTGSTVPLSTFASAFQRGSTNFTTITSTTGTYLSSCVVDDVRDGASYQAIWTGVYGDCTNGVLEYSVNGGSTWSQAAGGVQNVTMAAGTFRTYVFAYNGTISGLPTSGTNANKVYWRVRWITKLRSTYQSLYVFIDNTQ